MPYKGRRTRRSNKPFINALVVVVVSSMLTCSCILLRLLVSVTRPLLPSLPPSLSSLPTYPHTHTGVEGGPGSLIKYNPLSNLTSAETWNFLRVMGVPTNKLHACGYISIGCEPCTRPVLPNQHEREGRWWWEDSTGECCVVCVVHMLTAVDVSAAG